MTARPILSMCAAAMIASAAVSQPAETQVFRPAAASLNERHEPVARVSGRFVTGILLRGEPTGSAPRLSAFVPPDWAGTRPCVRVVSSDGLYVSETDYLAPEGWTGGVAEFEYPSRFAEILRDRYAHASAVAVTREPCDEEPTTFLPAFWNEAPSGSSAIAVLLLNSRNADRVFYFAGAGEEPVECSRVGGATTAYDFRCELKLPAGAPLVEIELAMFRRGGRDPARLLEIVVGSP